MAPAPPEESDPWASGRSERSRVCPRTGLAVQAEVDHSYVSLVERGIQGPTIQAVVKMAEALGVRPSEIVRRMEEHLEAERKQAKKPG